MPSDEYIRDLENNRSFHSYGYDEGYKDGYAKGYEDGKIEQEPKVGEWLEKEVISDKVIEEWQSARCSSCNRYHTTPYMYYFSNYKFCPNCGARIGEEVET
jgi:hypothetical protein